MGEHRLAWGVNSDMAQKAQRRQARIQALQILAVTGWPR
jgi:hypothetical protein